MKATEDILVEVVAETLGIEKDKISLGSCLEEDLDEDELHMLELVMAVEEEFGIQFPQQDAERVKTVGDILNYLKERDAKKDEENVARVPKRGV